MKKIDIFLDGVYECSTEQSHTCREAIERYREKYLPDDSVVVTASFSKD